MSYTPDKLAEYVFSQDVTALASNASITTPWIDMENVDKYQFEGIGSALGFDQVIESSSQPGGTGSTLTSTTRIVQGFQLFNVIARQRYLRFTWTNKTGAPVNAGMAIKVTYGSSDKLSVSPLGVEPTDFSQSALVRSVQTGQQPDGDYVNGRTDGTAVSTSTPLAASGVFTSDWVDSDGWNSIRILVASNVASAEKGITVQFTDDVVGAGSVVRLTKTYWFDAADVIRGFIEINLPPILDGFRIIYTNGTTAQTSFLMQAEMKINAENGKYNPAGALQTTDFLSEVALGAVPNYTVTSIFGRNPVLNSGQSGDVWNGNGTYTGHPLSFTPQQMQVNSSNAADSSAGTGARTVEIRGLRTSLSTTYSTEIITLNGTTRVNSVNTWWRINQLRVLTAGSQAENVGSLEVRPITTTSAIMAVVPAGYNRSVIAAYTVPAQRTLLVKRVRVTVTRANGSLGSATVTLRGRRPGGVFESLRIFELQTGSATAFELLGGIVLDPGTDVKFRVESVSDNATVTEAAMEFLLVA